ncbi:MAG: hypothetical protein A3F04_02005 [Candidatus Chisholmbacteria bacterium RIFCSPHIGHO2_12_FULL_49_9]|nr:MAG: hypothetical protein A3F04_02005 [Candidatus Chisholmbacteria bacterium RIFCSPHIGHO2_12_FULL_49_9]OGY20128.1 MAG: hypothetical protein A2900_03430 [Candidatus Chisholmbacteria bacterium RIFCSPLOWO2_01_FULL_50_28]
MVVLYQDTKEKMENLAGKKGGKNRQSRALFTFVGIALLVSIIHLSLFSFRETEDSPCWIAVGEYFLGQEEISRINPHCLQNPLIPGAAALLSWATGIPVAGAYLPLNLAALVGSGILLYRIALKLTNRKVAAIAALLFLIDFHSQYYAFSVMPDSLTWFFELLLIFLMILLISKNHLNNTAFFLYGIIFGLAPLIKMNLVFLFPIIFAYMLKIKRAKRITLLFLFILSASLPLFIFYSWIKVNLDLFPWFLLSSEIQDHATSVREHLFSFVSAFLYIIPFIIFAAFKYSFNKKYNSLMILIATGLLVPIFIWPYAMSRFAFTLFVILLPLAASGMLNLSDRVTLGKKFRRGLLVAILIGLYLLNTLRIYLTFSNISHLEFIKRILFASQI